MNEIASSPLSLRQAAGHVLVFDSGVGGLTVARELIAAAPQLTVDFSADTGFFPYGDKSDAALRARLPELAAALCEHVRPDVFVMACNTASTLALEEVRAAVACPVIGTVPAIKPAVAHSQTGTIGLLATPGTIRRSYTDRLIHEFASEASVIKHGSIELVRLAEAVARGERPALSEFSEAQQPLFDAPGGDRMDVIVLACTHFPLIRDQLIASAPRPVAYIDSGEAIARQTLRLLDEAALTAPRRSGRAYITDDPEPRGALRAVFARFGFDPMTAIDLGDRAAA